jgi:threonine/homoserine/homoserine lactone efflux protein
MIFQTGSMMSDLLWAIATLSGLAVLRPSLEVQLLLGASGGLLILGMGCDILRKAWCEQVSATLPKHETALLLGMLIGLANPFTFLFWLGIGGGLLAADASVSPLVASTLIIGAFILANLLWSFLLAALAACGHKLIQPATIRWIDAGAGVCMALFGVALCWQTLTALTPLFA